MLKRLIEAVERLRRRFDLSAYKAEQQKALRAKLGKRPPKRRRGR